MIQQEGFLESAARRTSCVGFTFPSIASVIVQSKNSHSWGFDSIGQFSRRDEYGLLPLEFLNCRNPEKNHEKKKEKAIEKHSFARLRPNGEDHLHY